ncbi:MAG TPA: GatB/YqeY domain-containing protein, partial [Thermoanaerobaculia bacterium]|nr:GatB/YqeY domain-containing protein [Thermoanaerobaculia bacterium]
MSTTIPPQQRIEADVKAALKAGEKEKLSTLRMLLGEIKNERIRKG